jgi:hypothetical protein
VLHQVGRHIGPGNKKLMLQWCRYIMDSGELCYGFRFVWHRDGRLEAARGQARLPSLEIARALINDALADGWGEFVGADAGSSENTSADGGTGRS